MAVAGHLPSNIMLGLEVEALGADDKTARGGRERGVQDGRRITHNLLGEVSQAAGVKRCSLCLLKLLSLQHFQNGHWDLQDMAWEVEG